MTPAAYGHPRAAPTSHAGDLPGGFSDTVEHTFAEGLYPTAVAWTPDRRLLATTKEGRLWVFNETDQGYGQPTAVLNLSERVCANGERGLVGLTVDPNFERNRFVYLYWTHDVHEECATDDIRDAPENRVTRHKLSQAGTEVPGSRKVIVDHIVSPRPHHLAGDLQFGHNGFLYIAVGDSVCRIDQPNMCGGGVNNNSQQRDLPQGKILRVRRSGYPVPTNPYVGDTGARRCTRPAGIPDRSGPCKEIFASGFRNPFRIARPPATNRFFVNDVGWHTWEEINRLRSGRNYGWNIREGHCASGSTTDCGPTRFTNPIHDYRHTECRSVTGGAFVPKGLWPERFDGVYLFADFTCDTVFRLVRGDNRYRHRELFTGLESPVHLRFGPAPEGRAMYYLNFFGREIHRIAYDEDNVTPVADFSFTPDGFNLAFDGSDSYDPDRDGITEWGWDFGDGTTRSTPTPHVEHTYSDPGTYDVILTVTDSEGATSEAVTKQVRVPEHPPSLDVDWPDRSARFAVDQLVRLRATASDVEDGQLPDRDITWEFRLQHDQHFHPYAEREGARVRVRYPAPEDLGTTHDSHLVVIVKATDSSGLTTRDRHELLPNKVQLTFRTRPRGGRVFVDELKRIARFTVLSWQGHTFRVRAPDQRFDGRRYVFRSWSDGGAREHAITTPGAPRTYTARFRRLG